MILKIQPYKCTLKDTFCVEWMTFVCKSLQLLLYGRENLCVQCLHRGRRPQRALYQDPEECLQRLEGTGLMLACLTFYYSTLLCHCLFPFPFCFFLEIIEAQFRVTHTFYYCAGKAVVNLPSRWVQSCLPPIILKIIFRDWDIYLIFSLLIFTTRGHWIVIWN